MDFNNFSRFYIHQIWPEMRETLYLDTDMIVLTVYGKLPPLGINTWIGFVAAMTFILLFVALPFITKKDAGGAS